MTSLLLTECVEGIATVTLNRPERLNAINQPLVEELLAYFEGLRRDESVRVVLLQGAGTGFCSGADVKAFGQPDMLQDGPSGKGDWYVRDLLRAMRNCPQPIITLVHGAAIGAGFIMALCSDVIIATENARFRTAFINLGLTGSETGMAWRLQRTLGLSRAREMMLTGKRDLSADEALQGGLVSAVVAEEALAEHGLVLAREMAEAPIAALRMTKRALDAALEIASVDAAMEMDERGQLLTVEHIRAARAAAKPID